MALNAHNMDGQAPWGKPDSGHLLTAREKKLLAIPVPDENNEYSNDGCSDEEASEWKSAPSEILSLNQNINFESTLPIDFTEAWSFFQSCDMSEFLNRNDQNQPRKTFRRKFHSFMGHPALNSALVLEKDLVFTVAACPMNNECTIHRRILQSIYLFLTKNDSCPRYGTHWEEVGFQGQDPASDLRGAGMFGALQILHLSSSEETKNGLAHEIYELSRHPVHQFPLAVLSLNVTRMTLDALRDGILNRLCNKKMDCIWTCQRFYLAIMYRIYKKWKDRKMTIHDSCYLLKSVEKWCRSHPRKAFSRLNQYLTQNDSLAGTGESKQTRSKVNSERLDKEVAHRLSWLDLTKPSDEVFI